MEQAARCVSAAGKKSVTGYTPPVHHNAAWHRLPPGVQSRSDVILLVFSEGYIWKSARVEDYYSVLIAHTWLYVVRSQYNVFSGSLISLAGRTANQYTRPPDPDLSNSSSLYQSLALSRT